MEDDLENVILKIIEILKKYCNNKNIIKETKIIDREEKLIDSLDIMSFICEIENTFMIEDLIYRDVSLSNFKDVYSLGKYILELRGKEVNEE